jgi:hypothetical protein
MRQKQHTVPSLYPSLGSNVTWPFRPSRTASLSHIMKRPTITLCQISHWPWHPCNINVATLSHDNTITAVWFFPYSFCGQIQFITLNNPLHSQPHAAGDSDTILDWTSQMYTSSIQLLLAVSHLSNGVNTLALSSSVTATYTSTSFPLHLQLSFHLSSRDHR